MKGKLNSYSKSLTIPLELINPITHSVHQMVKDMLQILLQDFLKRVCDHFVDIRRYSVKPPYRYLLRIVFSLFV